MKKSVFLLAALALAASCSQPVLDQVTTGQDEAQPRALSTARMVAAYYCPDWCQYTLTGVTTTSVGKTTDAATALKANLANFNTVLVDDTAAAYSDGTLRNISVDSPYPEVTTFSSTTQAAIQPARTAGKAIWAVIGDVTDTSGVDTVTALAGNAAALANFKTKLVAFATNANVVGVNIDFEDLVQATNGTARTNLNKVITAIYPALKAAGKKLMVSVPSKDAAEDVQDASFIYYWNYDYATLGANSDYVQIMSYDQTIGAGTVGPCSGLGWMKSCLTYATTKMAPTKVLSGIPAYGYDYVGSLNGASTSSSQSYLTNPKIAKYASTKATSDGTPYVTYTLSGKKHTLFYDDADSIGAKVDLANDGGLVPGGLGGVTVWALGGEFSGEWTAIAKVLVD